MLFLGEAAGGSSASHIEGHVYIEDHERFGMLNMEQLMHTCGYFTETLQRAVWILFGKPLWQSTPPQSPNPLLAVNESSYDRGDSVKS